VRKKERRVGRPFWIDTDVGSDDAVALIMALRHADVDVVGISAVAGNVPMEQAAQNALQVAELCGSNVPVYRGADRPMLRALKDGTWFHGPDGLSGTARQPSRTLEKRPAVEALLAAEREHDGLVLVTLGPLTNIAVAVAQEPGLADRISRCVVMGGAACTYGNVTPAAEYNIWVDPEAARLVFLSGLPVEMVGWEFCQGEYALGPEEIEQLSAIGSPLSEFVLACNRTAIESYRKQTGEEALSLPDPVAMAVAIEPAIATRRGMHAVEIETESELTRGMTVVDKLGVVGNGHNRTVWQQALTARRKVSVTWDIDAARWKELLYELLRER
jgi:purine nucleosidase